MTDAVLLGGVALLERAVNYTLGALHHVTPSLLGVQTPCAEWNLRALLAHMDDSLLALHEAALGEIGLSTVDEPAADPVALLRNRACQLLGAWTSSTGGPASVAGCALSPGLLTAAGAIEVTVHGWDVARACRADLPIPPVLADELLDLAQVLITDADRPHRFAPPLAPAGPTAADQLLAFLGRDCQA